MCKRNTTDPLLRTFLDTYHLNLLAIPRADAAPGDVYVETAQGISAPGRLEHVLADGFELPPVRTGEALADLSGKVSRSFDVKIGLGVLESFLAALGAAGLLDEAKAGYSKADVRTVRFRFRSAVRDAIDPMEFGLRISQCTVNRDNAFVRAARRFYVTTAVVRTPSISILAADDSARAIDLELEALKAASVEGKASVSREASGEITYRGATPLAIGVELLKLVPDDVGRLLLDVPSEPVRLRSAAGVAPEPAPAWVGDAHSGDVFVRLPGGPGG